MTPKPPYPWPLRLLANAVIITAAFLLCALALAGVGFVVRVALLSFQCGWAAAGKLF